MSSERLPLRTAPFPEESLVGYMIRLAERNGVDKPQLLARSIGSPFTTPQAMAFGPFDLEPMSEAIGIEAKALLHMAYWPIDRGRKVRFLGTSVEPWMVSLKRRKVCPECLADERFHRAVWDLRLVSACPRHEVCLIDCCQECGRYFGWLNPNIVQCSCGADIRRIRVERVPTAELSGISFVHGKLHLDGFPVPRTWPLSKLSFSDALSLLLHLGWFGSGARQRFAPVLLSRRGIAPHRYMQIGIEACTDWPVSFHRYLEGLCERASVPYWRATRLRLLAEWICNPSRSRPLQRLLLPALEAFVDRETVPRAVYHLERIFISRLS